MLSALLMLLALQGCDGNTQGTAADGATEVTAAPPAALRTVRHGTLFVRRCWFASLTEEQVSQLGTIATGAAKRESAAHLAVSARHLDLSQILVDKGGPEALNGAAKALAKAERDVIVEELNTLVELVKVLGPAQMGSGGKESAVVALQEGLTANGWFSATDPFTRMQGETWSDDDLAKLVARRIELDRAQMAFKTGLAASTTEASVIDVTAAGWDGTYTTSVGAAADAWEQYRTVVVTSYTTWVAEMPVDELNKLILSGGLRGSLQLPQFDQGVGGGMGGDAPGGMGGGMGADAGAAGAGMGGGMGMGGDAAAGGGMGGG
ncbi:MAG: hypothetical protein FJ090_16745, partial [Deltaproteobacteria bacterium]|nr:hypothetical protein [Deltaproteobacteria bacterium]